MAHDVLDFQTFVKRADDRAREILTPAEGNAIQLRVTFDPDPGPTMHLERAEWYVGTYPTAVLGRIDSQAVRDEIWFTRYEKLIELPADHVGQYQMRRDVRAVETLAGAIAWLACFAS